MSKRTASAFFSAARLAGMLGGVLFFAGTLGAQQSLLDPSFNTTGIVRQQVDYDDENRCLLALPDTSVLIASLTASVSFYDEDVILHRFRPDGSADLSFGSSGALRFDFPGFARSKPVSMVAANDSTVYLLGMGSDSSGANSAFCLTALRTGGSIDTAFGQSGFVTFNFLGSADLPYSVNLQRDGKILVTGETFQNNVSSQEYAVIARFLPDGTPDSSFGGTGKIAIDFLLGPMSVRASASAPAPLHVNGGYFEDVAELPDGRLLCGGTYNNGFYYEGALFVFLPDGRPDSSFYANGLLRFDLHPGDNQEIVSVLVAADSSWVALQNHRNLSQPTDFSIITRDPASGNFTADAFDVNNTFDHCNSMSLDSSGHLWVTGSSIFPANMTPYYFSDEAFVYCLRKVPGSWQPEPLFNGSGKAEIKFDTTAGIQNAGAVIAIDAAGRPVISGTIYDPSNAANAFDAAAARLIGVDFASGIVTFPEDANGNVYPNPFIGETVLQLNQPVTGATLLLFNSLGQEILRREHISGDRLRIALSGQPAGVYYLRLSEGRHIICNSRLLVTGD